MLPVERPVHSILLLNTYYYGAYIAVASCEIRFVDKDASEFLGVTSLGQDFFDVCVRQHVP